MRHLMGLILAVLAATPAQADGSDALRAEFEIFYEANHATHFCFEDGGAALDLAEVAVRWSWSDDEKALWIDEAVDPAAPEGYHILVPLLRYIVWTDRYQCDRGPVHLVRIVCRANCVLSYDPADLTVWGGLPEETGPRSGGSFYLVFRTERDATRAANLLERIIEIARRR